ncbi:hypothetical protein K435DRAFT_840831 [Dendrothele bispora CBS 962.96]|uniref:Uncharacterized protein n=1 Tax=Dendrothele bispora (strain CBS 962.96) TaxID=1314807 RepID=A0A4S8LRI5_DENBC|nr:hypothetical protein K435DRAFT_840831 [Dendrothele bispora CBS 962.96]
MSETIRLEPCSVYICLTQLLVPGFHWGLYFTDECSVATRHEWAEVRGRRDCTSPAEAYGVTHMNPITETDQEGRMNLAFVKVQGYTLRPNQVPDLHALFSMLEPTGGSSSWIQNRKKGLSCRTWLMRALATLQGASLLVRVDPISSIEEKVKEIGTIVEERLGNGEDVGTLITEV